MAQQNINLGTANGQNGDFVRVAWDKAEDNFTELYNLQDFNDRIISGGFVNTVGLTFNVVINSYVKNGLVLPSTVSSISQTLTLADADPVNNRFDVIVVNEDETITVVQGISAVSPAKPIINSGTSLEVTTVYVAAGATTAVLLSNVRVYDENAGDPTEWNSSESTGGTRIELASAVGGEASLNSICVKTSWNRGDYFAFTGTTPILLSTVNSIAFSIKKQSLLDLDMFIAIYNGTTLVSRIHLYQDNYGLEQANSSSYQNIIISRNEFPYLFTEENFDTIRFISSELQEVVPTNNADIFLDDVKISVGNSVPSITGQIPTLDQVLFAGNTSTGNITTQGYTSTGTRLGGDLVVTLGDYDGEGNGTKLIIDDSTGVSEFTSSLGINGFLQIEQSGFKNKLRTPLLTADRVQDYQDKNGIIALLDDVTGAAANTFQEVLDAGNKAQSTNNFNSFEFNLTEGGSAANVNLFTSVGGAGTQGSGMYFTENFLTLYSAPNDSSNNSSLDLSSDWTARMFGSQGVYFNKRYDLGGAVDANTGRGYFFQGNTDLTSNPTGDTMSYGEFDFSAIQAGVGANANQVYSFPNKSGTVSLTNDLISKQDLLLSGTNIKTINGTTILGSGDIVITTDSTELLLDSSEITTSRVALVADADGLNNSVSAANVVITVNSDIDTLPIGSILLYKQSGAGSVTLKAGTGNLVNTPGQTYNVDDTITIRKISTNTWEFLNPPTLNAGVGAEILLTSSEITISRAALATDADGLNNSTSATDITITINSDIDSLPIGSILLYKQSGAGNVIVAQGTATTLANSPKQTNTLDETITLRKIGASAWEYLNPPVLGVGYDDTAIQAEVDLNTAKVGITAQQASDITTNNGKVGVTTEEANTIDSEPIGDEAQVLQVVSMTQAQYDLITPVGTTFYIING